jgi:hypothetical protein
VIAHIILFEPRADLTEQERTDILRALIHATQAVSGVLSLKIGRRIKHGLPGYEQMMRDEYEYAAIIEFEDMAALREYLQHPAHAVAGRHFMASAAAALAYDYVLTVAEERAARVSKKE